MNHFRCLKRAIKKARKKAVSTIVAISFSLVIYTNYYIVDYYKDLDQHSELLTETDLHANSQLGDPSKHFLAHQFQPNRIKEEQGKKRNTAPNSRRNMKNRVKGRKAIIRNKIRQIFQESHFPNLPDYFKVLNESFIRGVKNPCWFESNNQTNQTQSVRCLPYFFIAGTPKSASSDLFLRVVQHPDIHIPARKISKEQHWWTRERFGGLTWNEYLNRLSLGPYLQSEYCFQMPDRKVIFHYCKHLITGDGSASTFWQSYETIEELKGISKSLRGTRWNSVLQQIKALRKKTAFKTDINDDITLADIIYLLLPQSRIILIFKDPTERLYSDYKAFMSHHSNDSNVSPHHFDLHVNKFISSWKDCLKNNSDRFCAYNEQSIPQIRLRAQIGMYSLFLKDWLAVFPRHQILIVRNEDYKVDMKNILRKIYEHLSLRPLDENTLKFICKLPHHNINRWVKISDMLPQTRKRLKEFYKPYNIELAWILNDSKYLWQ